MAVACLFTAKIFTPTQTSGLLPYAQNPFIHEHMADFDKAAFYRSEKILRASLERQQQHQGDLPSSVAKK